MRKCSPALKSVFPAVLPFFVVLSLSLLAAGLLCLCSCLECSRFFYLVRLEVFVPFPCLSFILVPCVCVCVSADPYRNKKETLSVPPLTGRTLVGTLRNGMGERNVPSLNLKASSETVSCCRVSIRNVMGRTSEQSGEQVARPVRRDQRPS